MHLNSELVFQRYAKSFFRPGMRVLEIAPDKLPTTLQTLVGIDDISWSVTDLRIGINSDGGRLFGSGRDADMTFVMADPYVIPADDNTFDIVVAANVVEHVARTWVWIKELSRICRQGGYVILIAPVSWPEHKAPIDCWRILPDGMHVLASEAGLKIEVCEVASLEPKISRRSYPGPGSIRGSRPQTLNERISDLVFRSINWPRPVAYDIAAVMMKPVTKVN